MNSARRFEQWLLVEMRSGGGGGGQGNRSWWLKGPWNWIDLFCSAITLIERPTPALSPNGSGCCFPRFDFDLSVRIHGLLMKVQRLLAFSPCFAVLLFFLSFFFLLLFVHIIISRRFFRVDDSLKYILYTYIYKIFDQFTKLLLTD